MANLLCASTTFWSCTNLEFISTRWKYSYYRLQYLSRRHDFTITDLALGATCHNDHIIIYTPMSTAAFIHLIHCVYVHLSIRPEEVRINIIPRDFNACHHGRVPVLQLKIVDPQRFFSPNIIVSIAANHSHTISAWGSKGIALIIAIKVHCVEVMTQHFCVST